MLIALKDMMIFQRNLKQIYRPLWRASDITKSGESWQDKYANRAERDAPCFSMQCTLYKVSLTHSVVFFQYISLHTYHHRKMRHLIRRYLDVDGAAFYHFSWYPYIKTHHKVMQVCETFRSNTFIIVQVILCDLM